MVEAVFTGFKLSRFTPALCVLLFAAPAGALDPGQISRTSVMVACHRAITARDPNPETRNPDNLAEKLLDPELMSLAPEACAAVNRPFEEVFRDRMQSQMRIFFGVVARTKHIDETLEASLTQGAKQVVILGAGLDSRAYRLGAGHEGVRFFEVDSPATQQDKKVRVRRLLGSLPQNVVYVPVDFETQSLETELAEADFQAGQPSFFVWEGVTMYLNSEAVGETLDFVRGTAPGSSIIFDYVSMGMIDGTSREPAAARARRVDMLTRFGEPWLYGVPDGGTQELVSRHGLELVSDMGFQELFEQYLSPEIANAVLGNVSGGGGIAHARKAR